MNQRGANGVADPPKPQPGLNAMCLVDERSIQILGLPTYCTELNLEFFAGH